MEGDGQSGGGLTRRGGGTKTAGSAWKLSPEATTTSAAPSNSGPPERTAKQLLVEGCCNQIARIVFVSWALAWFLTRTSSSLAWNFPLAVAAVGVAFWISTQVEIRKRTDDLGRRERRTYNPKPRQRPVRPAPNEKWRQSVNAPIVEAAWEKLISNIIQEFVYDAFWHRMTPDCEFAAEVRHMANHLFGCLALRGKKVDVRVMLLRDMTDLMIEMIELYRDTRDSVGVKELDAMNPLARDRALRQEMKADGNLHPALYSNEQHYEVLKQLSDGALAVLLDQRDYARPVLQILIRELLASAILKPAIQMLMPAYMNKLLVTLLEYDFPELDPSAEAMRLHGEQSFEQRAAAYKDAECAGSPPPQSIKKRYLSSMVSPYSSKADLTNGAADSSHAAGEFRRHASEGSVSLANVAQADAAGDGSHGRGGMMGAADGAKSNLSVSPRKAGYHAELPQMAELAALNASKPKPAPGEKRAQGSSSHRHLSPEATGFDGKPFTKVVAAEINAERRSREYVVFNIRVHDATREWTVLRRFRNFEQLHKQLRNTYKYGGHLPPKRYIFASNNWEFVEERREQLDVYLKDIIASQAYGASPEVFEFLNPWSSAYALETDVSLLNVVANNLDNARHSVKNKVAGGTNRMAGRGTSIQPGDAVVVGAVDGGVEPRTAAQGPVNSRSMKREKDSAQGDAAALGPVGAVAGQEPECAVLNRSASDGALGGRDSGEEGRPPTLSPTTGTAGDSHIAGNGNGSRRSTAEDVGGQHASGTGGCGGDSALFHAMKKMGDVNFEEDSIGISRPLYLLVDAVFELQSHGFIWRQVTVVVKQMLSLVAGGTVDLLVAQKMHDMSSSHTWARLILRLRNLLWPGGVWFSTARAAAMVAKGEQPPGSSVPPGGYTKGNWLSLEMEMGSEERAMADKLRDILFNRAPPALVRIVGRSRYTGAVKDIYHILQSPTFMAQLGHGMVEILVMHLMPELKPLLEDIRSSQLA